MTAIRIIAGLLVFTALCLGFNPPVDTAGPLTVRLQRPALGSYGAGGYAELSRPGTPLLVPVSLENSSDRPLRGTLRLAVVDQWKVEPAGSIPFELRPRGRARFEFTVQFGPGTYNAHYPVHAYAEFEDGGTKYTAHPVMILETRIPDLERPKLPAEWKPVPVPPGGTLGLWRTPVRRESLEISNDGAEAGRAGSEYFEAATVIQYGALGAGDRREGILMTLGRRPPSRREVVNAAAVDYALALPAAKPLRLDFAVSGDMAFRVEVAEFAGGPAKELIQRRGSAGKWEPMQASLDEYAGRSIRLRLAVRGGEGEARWAEPVVVAGQAPQSPVFPPRDTPTILGKAGGCEVGLWRGSRGVLDAPVGLLCGTRRLYFRGFRAQVAGDALEQWKASTELLSATQEPAAGRHRVRHKFRNWAGSFDLLSELWVEAGALRARFWLENTPPPRPWFHLYLEGVSSGEWSEPVERVYAGAGNVMVHPKAFRLGYNGHNLSTSFVGFDFTGGQALVQNSNAIPDYLEVDPERRIYSLVTAHEQTLEFFPVSNVFAGVKLIREQDTRKASSGVTKLAGRFTFDLWGGRYAESAKALEQAARYGIRDAFVVWHRWQRWGYDYRLPDLYPPNPEFGSLEEFRQLVETCKRHGILFAPHDNYIDFYPDFEGFTYDSIVFRQNGTPYKAWFNYSREAQSYRARPDRLMPYVKRNVALLKDGFAPTSYFIDVWASIAPYDYWTADGKFTERKVTQRVWGEAFAWIRETLGDNAPQVSESGHDKLIGWLDGSDSQHLRVDSAGRGFTWRIDCQDAERIPWADVAWRDKFVLYGAGYPGRYAGGLDPVKHGAYGDDYISTEILTGRPAMVPDPFNREVVRKYWLVNDVLKALARDRIDHVEFAGSNIHRQIVRWESGARVWVNRGAEPWTVEGRTLPQYGFYARAGGAEAAVELREGKRVEWSRAPGRQYENFTLKLASGEVMQLPEK